MLPPNVYYVVRKDLFIGGAIVRKVCKLDSIKADRNIYGTLMNVNAVKTYGLSMESPFLYFTLRPALF